MDTSSFTPEEAQRAACLVLVITHETDMSPDDIVAAADKIENHIKNGRTK